MLLQGFPSTYRLTGNFSQQVTQVSNAVPPPMAQALARAIRQMLRQGGKER
jgi:DNA (cytosine-5)-methyltransferase 1